MGLKGFIDNPMVLLTIAIIIIVGVAFIPLIYSQINVSGQTYLSTQNLTFNETESFNLNAVIPCYLFLADGSITLTGYSTINPSLDMGNDGTINWNYTGTYTSAETADIPIAAIQAQLTGLRANCNIPNNFTATNGTLEITASSYNATTMSGATLAMTLLIPIFIVVALLLFAIKKMND